MKKSLLVAFFLVAPAVAFADWPRRVQSRLSMLGLYTESSATEKIGYGNWNPYEDGEFLMIKSFIHKGDTVIDAGAHIGDWSRLVLEHTNKDCMVYAFEPVPHFFKKLTSAVGDDVRCYNAALGSTAHIAMMNYYYEESEGCSSLFERKVLSSIPVKKIDVPVTYLDEFCRDHSIDRIDFLKIDTEGSEWDVLRGADDLITNKKISFIQFEYGGTYPDADITLQQVYTFLTSKGFAIFRIAPDGLIHIPQWKTELENFHLSNYLAVLND